MNCYNPFRPENFRSGNSLPRSLMFYRWQLFLMDLHQAFVNMGVILRNERPKMAQFSNGVWAILWGLNMSLKAPAIFAASPRLYAWMHRGLFFHLPAPAWGLAAFALGLLQMYVLCWPVRDPICKRIWAARLMCSYWTGMLTGFFLSGVPGNASIFYALLTAGSVWVLWRLADCKDPQCA